MSKSKVFISSLFNIICISVVKRTFNINHNTSYIRDRGYLYSVCIGCIFNHAQPLLSTIKDFLFVNNVTVSGPLCIQILCGFQQFPHFMLF